MFAVKSIPLPLSPQVLSRFWSRIDSSAGAFGCWSWLSLLNDWGYGRFQFSLEKKQHEFMAHRLAFALTKGPLSTDRIVCHTCDNPSCCNPLHLWAGTHRDNMVDMAQKKRGALGDRNGSRLHPEKLARGQRNGAYTHPEKVIRGTQHYAFLHPETRQGIRNGRAKLNETQVIEIRRMVQQGYTQKRIAAQFGVSKSAIWYIVKGEHWKNVSA